MHAYPMSAQSTVFLVGAVLVLATELLLWRLFRRRVHGFIFPREIDISPFRFFTLLRLRICVLVHAAFLLAVLGGSVLFLW